jgi:hypothetical protein
VAFSSIVGRKASRGATVFNVHIVISVDDRTRDGRTKLSFVTDKPRPRVIGVLDSDPVKIGFSARIVHSLVHAVKANRRMTSN